MFLFRRREFESDLEEEMRFHLEMKARDAGPDAARRQFGNATLLSEQSREAWGWASLDAWLGDLKYATRMLGKNSGFTAVAVLTMALGIGVNTVMFSVVYAVLLRSLPYPDASRLIRAARPDAKADSVNMPELAFWKEHSTSVSSMAGYRDPWPHGLNLGDRTETVQTMEVSTDFLRTLQVAPQIGREFQPEDTRPKAPRAVMLSDRLWRQTFGGDHGIAGRVVTIDGVAYTVVGVLPAGFWFENAPDALLPLRFTGTIGDLGSNTQSVARLKPGVSLARARAEFAALSESYRRTRPAQENNPPLTAQSYQEWLRGDVRSTLWLLFGASALLLLIACTNLAGLLLARLAARQKEVAMRMALGSGAGRVLRQFLTENLLLSVLGGAVGLAAAAWLLDGFVRLAPFKLPSAERIHLDWTVLAFTGGIVIGTTLLFSLAPFVNAWRLNVYETLKTSGRSGAGGRTCTRSLLVVGETALSVALVLAAALMIQSLYRLHRQRLGFDPRGVVTFRTPLSPQQRRNPAELRAFNQDLLERLQMLPGVRAAAAVSLLPLTSQGNFPVEHAGHPDHDFGGMEIRHVTPGYFEAVRTPIVLGRGFDARDAEDAPPVILVNETVARAWWSQASPLGDRVVIGRFRGKDLSSDTHETPREVIGVVADTKTVELKAAPRPTVYVPLAQTSWYDGSMNWVVRGNVTATALDRTVAAASPAVRMDRLRSMEEIVASTTTDSRFYAWLFGAFAGFALALTAVGVYGLLAFSVARRTNEIGTRMALGASRGSVLAMILKQGIALTFAGLLLGLAGAVGLARSLAKLLFGVRPLDPVSFAAVAGVLLCVGLVASYLPARRATRVDPMEALRNE